MAENIVINFEANTQGLVNTINLLEKLGQVDKKTADEFRQATNAYEQQEKAVKQLVTPIEQLSKSIKTVGQEASKAFIIDKTNTIVKATTNIVSLRTEIKKAQQEAIELARQFGAGSDQALRARENAAKLKNELQSANRAILALDPQAKFTAITQLGSAMAGIFQVATGALQAFGVESETATRLAKQFQGALNIAFGLNSITQLGDAFKNIKSVLGITDTALKITQDNADELGDAPSQITFSDG